MSAQYPGSYGPGQGAPRFGTPSGPPMPGSHPPGPPGGMFNGPQAGPGQHGAPPQPGKQGMGPSLGGAGPGAGPVQNGFQGGPQGDIRPLGPSGPGPQQFPPQVPSGPQRPPQPGMVGGPHGPPQHQSVPPQHPSSPPQHSSGPPQYPPGPLPFSSQFQNMSLSGPPAPQMHGSGGHLPAPVSSMPPHTGGMGSQLHSAGPQMGSLQHSSGPSVGPQSSSAGIPQTGRGGPLPPQGGMGPPLPQGGMGPPHPQGGMGPTHPQGGMGPPPPQGGMGLPPPQGGMGPPNSGGPSHLSHVQPQYSVAGSGQGYGGQAPLSSMGPPGSTPQVTPFAPGQVMQGHGFGQQPTGFNQPHGMGAPPAGPLSMSGPVSSHGMYGGMPSAPHSMGPAQPGGFPGSQQSGFAPQPGYNMQQPQQQGLATQPQQQARRLDPDQMPSPIQVIEDDKRSRSGPFQANQKGTLPPLVTTPFIMQDQGFAHPKFLRSTMYNVPCTSDMLKASHIPFALCITPFATLTPQEVLPPIVDLGELGPVRCKRCKAYMNPYMQFIDGGRRFQCVFCSAATDVPNEYFAHLDHTGRRVDCYNRAELCLGTYEVIATKDYCKNNVLPKEPAFIFMIDVSYNSVKSGLVSLICERLKDDILVNLPKESGAEESEIRVGFVTYHKELHFYNVKSSLAQPQMMVVSDVEDMFVPLVDGFLVKLSESEAIINSLLSQIPQMFADCKETETVLAPVVQAGLDALKSSDRCGRLYIFHTSLPSAEAPGKLKNRDDRKLLGTEKEKTILTPQTNIYQKIGQECVAAGCSVDLFLFPNSYCDVATITDVVRLSSGNMYKYSYFQADLDGDRFMEDLRRNVERPVAFDAVLRVRTSTGIRPVDFYGNFYMSNTTDVELAAMDSEQSVAVEIKHDDKLSEAEGAYVQIAVLYTSISGQRRLRVINQAFNCCTQMADLFRFCELDTLINFLAKQAIRQTLNHNPKFVREHIMNEVSQILACYRKNCANPSSAGQLILPECMKLLPLYANCILKSDGIQGGSEISTDDRSYLMYLINGMDVKHSNVFFYPRLLPFHTADLESSELPTAIRCSVERLQDNGMYLLENGLSMFLWIGLNVDRDLIHQVFGVASAAQVDIDKVHLMDLDNPASRKLRDMVQKIRQERTRYLKLTIVRQRDKLEQWFNHFLVEDKGMNGSSSYVDFLCHIHKEIRNILS